MIEISFKISKPNTLIRGLKKDRGHIIKKAYLRKLQKLVFTYFQ